MSINILMVPVALATRVVMGKERFDEFVKSSEIRARTVVKKEVDIGSLVNKAGYDFEDYFGLKKTHLLNNFFFWEIQEGVWEAVFSKYDDMEQIELFKQKLIQAAGKNIFIEEKMRLNENELIDSNRDIIYPTNFVDKDMLIKTLKDYGIGYIMEGSNIVIDSQECYLEIFKYDKPYYEVRIKKNSNFNKAYFYLNNIDEEYKKMFKPWLTRIL